MMSRNIIKGYVTYLKGKFEQAIGLLTVNNKLLQKGKKEEMFGKLQSKLNVPNGEMERIIGIFNQPLY